MSFLMSGMTERTNSVKPSGMSWASPPGRM